MTAPPTTATTSPVTVPEISTTAGSAVTAPLAMLRVDDAGAATIEALLCNTGQEERSAVAFLVGSSGPIPLGQSVRIPGFSCRGAFDPGLGLEAFGIPGDGIYELTVRVEAGATVADYHVTLPIEYAGLSAPAEQVAAYDECRATYDHATCAHRMPHFPVPGSGEVMMVLGDLRAVAPGQWEDIAAYQVADDTICLPLIEGFLGVTGPRPAGWRDLVLAEPAGSGMSALPGVAMYLGTTTAEYQRFRDDLDAYGWRQTFLAGECGNEHEATHLVLGEVPLPTVLNEGLATLAAALDGSGALSQRQVECSETGWRHPGEAAERPFEDLDADAFTLEMIYSSVCFWEYLRNAFGADGFQAVISGLHALQSPEFNGCRDLRRTTPFMTAVVTPALGADLTSITEARWGFGAGFTGCEHV